MNVIYGESLQDLIPENHIIQQVVNIPKIKVKVIELRAEVKKCPKCSRKNTASFSTSSHKSHLKLLIYNIQYICIIIYNSWNLNLIFRYSFAKQKFFYQIKITR